MLLLNRSYAYTNYLQLQKNNTQPLESYKYAYIHTNTYLKIVLEKKERT